MSPVFGRFRQAALLLSLPLMAMGLGACFTTISKQASKATNTNQVPTKTGTAAAFTLSQVLRDTTTSTLTFDLIGDGSGAMGQYCAPTSGSESATTCNCSIAYTLSSGASESIEVPTSYGEADLVRCRYDRVPADATYAKIKLHTTSGAYSSEVLFRFTGAGAANLSDPESFAKVLRYQCRDIVTIPNILDRGIYDPFQSEDRSITYPLNFYTTNLGASYALYASKNVQGWYCPPIPNDPDEGMNLTTYSVASDSGSYLIYPPLSGNFDRSNFYVSKKAAGVFTVPINAYIAPRIVTGATASAIAPPLGYGASPIPNSSGGEDCPSGVTIPPGFDWAKLWLFRADLPSRNYIGSAKLPQLGAISCNPGKWNTGTAVFNSCGDGTGGSVNGGLTVADGLADRILGTNMCVRVQPYGAGIYSSFSPCGAGRKGVGCTTQNDGTQFVNYTTYAKGSDSWIAIAEVLGCSSPTLQDPMGVCTNGVPFESSPPAKDLDAGNSRFDYLFVVSPTSVNVSDMQNTSGAVHRKYAPFRFPKGEDCAAVDPNTCDINKAIQYGLKLHDVTGNGDPPGNDPTRPGQFPVCVLQENS